MRRRREKLTFGGIMIRAAAGLFCLVLISTSMMSGLYARYTVHDSGYDSARVIKFHQLTVTETGDFTEDGGVNKFIFIPGVPIKKAIRVSFGGSEAATIVFVAAKTTGWNAAENGLDFSFGNEGRGLTWSVNSSDWTYLKNEGGVYVYYKVLDPNPNPEFKDIPFIENDTVNVSENGTVTDYISYAEGENCRIDITAYAVQANGFESVEDAWKALND